VAKFEAVGVEAEAAVRGAAAGGVAGDRVADGGGVDAKLVGAAGDAPNLTRDQPRHIRD
jgi:hypothetical protein